MLTTLAFLRVQPAGEGMRIFHVAQLIAQGWSDGTLGSPCVRSLTMPEGFLG